jgi:hypothetical protein
MPVLQGDMQNANYIVDMIAQKAVEQGVSSSCIENKNCRTPEVSARFRF